MTAVTATTTARPPGLRRGTKIALGVCLVLLAAAGIALLILIGRPQPKGLDTSYGRHRLAGFPASINGTDVLAGMFTAAGHKVHYRSRIISSEMERADTIVWFPNDYAAPSLEVCYWFDDWLAASPGRTVIYVGRDFSATPQYWQYLHENRQLKEFEKIPPASEAPKPTATKDEERTDATKEAEAAAAPADSEKSKEDAPRKAKPKAAPDKSSASEADDEPLPDDDSDTALECEWFDYDRKPIEPVRELAGPWAEGIDAERASLSLGTRMVPAEGIEELLVVDDDLLAGQLDWEYWAGSQLLLVANGSFLLNVPLVNHENRKLAGKLVATAGEPGRVVFLESGRGGPAIDPPYDGGSLWTVFGAWPLNVVLLQLAAAGVIFCFARWPIFGRPRQGAAEVTTDFSKHVAAVGKLLSRTRDRSILTSGASGAGATPTAASPTITLGPDGQPDSAAPPLETKGT